MTCLICNEKFDLGKQLSNHIKKIHNLDGKIYTIKYIQDDKKPQCLSCGNETRYTSFSFKKYCFDCSKIAMKEGGKSGGLFPAWNKGKTKENDLRLASQSLKIIGENNHFFGKRHTKESLEKISSNKRIDKNDFYERLKMRSDIAITIDYSSFIDRNQKNIKCKCQNCSHEFITSLSYIERKYKCPECHIRQPSFIGKEHRIETKEIIRKKVLLNKDSFEERTKQRTSEFTLLTSYENYFSRQKQYLQFQCNECNTINEKTLQAFERGSLCQKCFPNSSSRAELEIGDYIGSLGLIPKRNDRSIINPKELDIIVEDKKAAFEYDGLYWHDDNSGKPRDYHYNKTKDCHAAGLSLFRIYSDQWENKNELVRAMIKCRLGIISKKIYARECQVSILDQSLSKEFFDKNHLYGSSPSKITFGLIHNNELVLAVSMRIPRQEKYKQEDFIEICRFASSHNTIVVGGFSKIFKGIKSWSIENSFKNILTYADLDTGTGNVYEKSGFQLAGETGPAYWYSDGQKRFDRFKFRAQNNKTEMQIANDAGVVRIYGAGSKIYKYAL